MGMDGARARAGGDFEEICELALRRCGDQPARFCEVAPRPGETTSYLARRIRETVRAIRHHVVLAAEAPDGLRLELARSVAQAGLTDLPDVHPRAGLEAAGDFEDEALDFVLLGALEGAGALEQGLAAFWPKLRAGGILSGAGYTTVPGVAEAVRAFAASRGARAGLRTSGASWLLHKSLRVDAAYCINLPSRTDRRRAAEAQFRRAGLEGRVEFFAAIDGRTLPHSGRISHGQAGCVASHLQVLADAERRGARHVLVFEDDVEVVPDFVPRFEAALARCPASYVLLYAGALCVKDWGNYLYPLDDLLSRAGNVLGTHAYVLNMEHLPRVRTALEGFTRVIDEYFVQDIQPHSNAYVCTPYLAFQAPGHSDVAQTYRDSRTWAEYVWR